MKSTPDQLAQRLIAALEPGAVSFDEDRLAAHKIEGKQPTLLCTPSTRDQVSAALRVCSEAAASVIPWGGGTAMALGNPPRQVDVVLATARLNLVLDHDAANLTVTVESGISLAALQNLLAEEGQFVPFDPPFPERSTIGGIVAANLNGPRRSCYGSVRDLVIGMKVALISGEQIKAGGKVVKNVAGYDMCKLFVGALGTLGVITEATLRLAPVPESAATVIVSGTSAQARQFVHDLSRSLLLPAAIFLSNQSATERWQVAIWCEGFHETVARSQHDLADLGAQVGMKPQFLSAEDHGEFWQSLQNFPLHSGRLVFRITVPRAEVFDVVQALRMWHDPTIISDTVTGTIWLACEPTKASVQRFSELASMARARGGHAVIFAAPSALKQGFEVWGESPPTISLMRDIKQQFDPKGLLNAGRFLAGI